MTPSASLSKHALFALFVAGLLAVASCDDTSATPTAATATSPVTIAGTPQGNGLMLLRATTPTTGVSQTFAWKVDKGTLLATTGQQVEWRLPTTSGAATASVTVTDTKNGSRSGSQSFTVGADGTVSNQGTTITTAGTPSSVVNSTTGLGQVEVPLPIGASGVANAPVATAAPLPGLAPVIAQPVAVPSAKPLPSPPIIAPIAVPTPTPSPVPPPASPVPTPKPPTPQPGVPTIPVSLWLQVDPLKIPTTSDLYGVQMVESPAGVYTEAWSVGNEGTVIHSADAGATWEMRRNGIPTSLNIVKVAFVSADQGFVGASDGEVFRTTDRGLNWVKISTTLPYTNNIYGNLTGLMPINAQSLYVTTYNGEVYRTDNANAADATTVTWRVFNTKGDPNTTPKYMYASTAFPTGATADIAWFGGDGIFQLNAATPTWKRPVFFPASSGIAKSAAMPSLTDIYFGTDAGHFVFSHDSGVTWTDMANFRNRESNGGEPLLAGPRPIVSLSFIDSNNGWGLRNTFEVIDTYDGGTTWKLTRIPIAGNDLTIHDKFENGTRKFFGLAVGAGGDVLRYVPN
jgi:photosystem II stability/assembly factor-like uncharacterized protein